MKKLGVFTSVCEEDKEYIPQYIAEIDRMNMDFAMHFDNCSDEIKEVIKKHPHCVGFTETDNPAHPFDERDKQGVLDILANKDYDWAINWDMDETWEKSAPEKMRDILENTDYGVLDYKWVCLWEDPQHIRVDGALSGGHRARIYNLRKPVRWIFYSPVINGAAAYDLNDHKIRMRNKVRVKTVDLVCIHWGYMTKELRLKHKERWDRLYGNHGGNPSGFWDWINDGSITPTVIEHNYS